MSATNPGVTHPQGDRQYGKVTTVRTSTETKASYKTTEFMAYIAMLVAIFVAGAVTTAGTHSADVFRGHQVWLYATILTIGYMISRGLAKTGSREPYREDR
jgi:hypothetical protein